MNTNKAIVHPSVARERLKNEEWRSRDAGNKASSPIPRASVSLFRCTGGSPGRPQALSTAALHSSVRPTLLPTLPYYFLASPIRSPGRPTGCLLQGGKPVAGRASSRAGLSWLEGLSFTNFAAAGDIAFLSGCGAPHPSAPPGPQWQRYLLASRGRVTTETITCCQCAEIT